MPDTVKKEKSTLNRNADRKSASGSEAVKKKREPVKKQTPVEHAENISQKRLYRIRKNAMIAGVAAGIGEYFSLDPAIIRLLFVLATFFGGSGVPVYIILWVILPESESGNIGSAETVQKNTSELREKAEEFTKIIRTGGSENKSRMMIGYILIGLGILIVMQNFGIFRAEIFWPVILIVSGFFLLRSK